MDKTKGEMSVTTKLDSGKWHNNEYSNSRIDTCTTHLSEVLYEGLCGLIGTPTQVKIRRDVKDVDEISRKPASAEPTRIAGHTFMESGSYREGFRLPTSDIDLMYWYTNDIVINDMSQIPDHHHIQSLIVMECHDTLPGFAKLQLLSTHKDIIKLSCVRLNHQLYISGLLYRQNHCIITENQMGSQVNLHGPCTSGKLMGALEFDFCFCFKCPCWPSPAFHWQIRCERQGWPPKQVLHDIISDGCHLVPIGSGISSPARETEWRLSFSQAEYKLVSSMNHTQFLCYGLLKLFLKEVLNDGKDEALLCSYFMKTCVFWKIQDNKNCHWRPKNILHCVWICFKYLVQCVYRGEFPNFFIPENNMFLNKIHGAAQIQLFEELQDLYNKGISCILRSPSLYDIMVHPLLDPRLPLLQVNTDEVNMISEEDLDIEYFREVRHITTTNFLRNFEDCHFERRIRNIDHFRLTHSVFSQFQTAAIHTLRNFTLIRIAFMDKPEDFNQNTLDMLISVAENGCISDALYVAIYLYKKKRYPEALHYVNVTKEKLHRTYLLDMSSEEASVHYIHVVGGHSIIEKMKRAVLFDIDLDQFCCIDELKLELYVCLKNCFFPLSVPPLVMAHMLSYLCQHHMENRLGSKQSLEEFRTLLHLNQEKYICLDVSWQLLGICEQVYGNLYSALQCYHESLLHPLGQIKEASYIRIQNISSKIH